MSNPAHNIETVDLDDLRIDHPLQCIAYASKNNLMKRKGFQEWIDSYLNADTDLTMMVHNYWISTITHQFKYGIEIPCSAKHALELDQKYGHTYWLNAIDLEIKKMLKEFKTFCVHPDKTLPSGYKKLRCHFVFDVKIDGRYKAHWVMDGSLSPPMPHKDCFASVVYTEAVHLGFTLAQIHNLKCVAGNVSNAFLTAFTYKKIYVVAGPEFGKLQDTIMVMVKAVYGTKTAALRFHKTLSH